MLTGGGSDKTTLVDMLQPPVSDAVTKYSPVPKSEMFAVFPTIVPLEFVQTKEKPPPKPPEATAATDPSSRPLQLGSVPKAKTSTGGISTVTMS